MGSGGSAGGVNPLAKNLFFPPAKLHFRLRRYKSRDFFSLVLYCRTEERIFSFRSTIAMEMVPHSYNCLSLTCINIATKLFNVMSIFNFAPEQRGYYELANT